MQNLQYDKLALGTENDEEEFCVVRGFKIRPLGSLRCTSEARRRTPLVISRSFGIDVFHLNMGGEEPRNVVSVSPCETSRLSNGHFARRI